MTSIFTELLHILSASWSPLRVRDFLDVLRTTWWPSSVFNFLVGLLFIVHFIVQYNEVVVSVLVIVCISFVFYAWRYQLIFPLTSLNAPLKSLASLLIIKLKKRKRCERYQRDIQTHINSMLTVLITLIYYSNMFYIFVINCRVED